jgi:peptidoglycan/xylan/chitin deacetylase (PgdA/CDA1 family)
MLRDLRSAIVACLLAVSPGIHHHASGDWSPRTSREVAVTFDDLPVAGTRHIAVQREITRKLLHSIASNKVPAIGFVNENKLLDGGVRDEPRVALLQQWLDAGLDLGNHSFSHPDLHRVALEDFQDDVIRGEETTRRLLMRQGRALNYSIFVIHFFTRVAIWKPKENLKRFWLVEAVAWRQLQSTTRIGSSRVPM